MDLIANFQKNSYFQRE